MAERAREILSWYSSDTPGVRKNIARLLNHGRLAGTGWLVILPVDQGFEHRPARSFAPNPPAYDPRYHFELAITAGCNAYAAPLGFLEAGPAEYADEIPLILKLNSSDSLDGGNDPCPAMTGSVDDALRLGCAAIGFTIYPASVARKEMYGQIRALSEEAKRKGLAVVVWSYPRGSWRSGKSDIPIDAVDYAAKMAAQGGAHIINLGFPTPFAGQPVDNRCGTDETSVAAASRCVRKIVEKALRNRRVALFLTGGGNRSALDEARAIIHGGGMGSTIDPSILGHLRGEALQLLESVMAIFTEGAEKRLGEVGQGRAALQHVRQRGVPRTADVYRVLLASPSDADSARQAAREAIQTWNIAHFADSGVMLEAVSWETHAFPQMGSSPQSVINTQLLSDTDILVAIFKRRFGTPTDHAKSDTAEEIEQFVRAGKPVLVYFCSSPVTVGSVDAGQHRLLASYQQNCMGRGLVSTYGSIPELKERLQLHLTGTIRNLRAREPFCGQLAGAPNRETALCSEAWA
jgi:class I fructose-bisphosphate aldolase